MTEQFDLFIVGLGVTVLQKKEEVRSIIFEGMAEVEEVLAIPSCHRVPALSLTQG